MRGCPMRWRDGEDRDCGGHPDQPGMSLGGLDNLGLGDWDQVIKRSGAELTDGTDGDLWQAALREPGRPS